MKILFDTFFFKNIFTVFYRINQIFFSSVFFSHISLVFSFETHAFLAQRVSCMVTVRYSSTGNYLLNNNFRNFKPIGSDIRKKGISNCLPFGTFRPSLSVYISCLTHRIFVTNEIAIINSMYVKLVTMYCF